MTEAIGNNSDLARLMASLTQQTGAGSGASALSASDSSQAGGTRDMITLSKAAQAAAALWDTAAGSGVSLLAGSGDATDLDSAMAKAEAGLQDLMERLGISGDLEFTLSVNPDGSIAVNSDDPNAAKLEEAINADPALRDALVDVHAMASKQRIAEAMSQALEAARADTDQAGGYFTWVRDIIDQTRSADQVFTLRGGSLTTSFADSEGNRFGTDDGLSLTA